MKAGSKILYHCGENSSHRLLLVRGSNAADSWKWYVYAESTGEVIAQASKETDVDRAERAGQLAALRAGVSPILHDREVAA